MPGFDRVLVNMSHHGPQEDRNDFEVVLRRSPRGQPAPCPSQKASRNVCQNQMNRVFTLEVDAGETPR
jgi:hypothetical protein